MMGSLQFKEGERLLMGDVAVSIKCPHDADSMSRTAYDVLKLSISISRESLSAALSSSEFKTNCKFCQFSSRNS